MATSKIILAEIGEVTIYRRRGLKYIRLRVDAAGRIRLSLPWYVPKAAGLAFVKQKARWIALQQQKLDTKLENSARIGSWKLEIIKKRLVKPVWQLENNVLSVSLPELSQPKIQKVIAEAIRKVAEDTLPKRLAELAEKYDIKYSKVRLSRATTRWGSCSHKASISLNIRLVTLPSELIDYVIIHELSHVKELNHSKKFWQLVAQFDPDYKDHRKKLRAYSATYSLS